MSSADAGTGGKAEEPRQRGAVVAKYLPGLAVIAAITLVAMLVNQVWPLVSALLIAIVLGAVVGNIRKVPVAWKPGIGFASRKLLRFGIILLGLQITLGTLLGLGWQRLVLVVVIVAAGVAGTLLLGKLLGIDRRLTALIAAGFSICGAAAVAGAKEVVGADEEETGTALALVVVFGTLSIPIVPALAQAVSLAPQAAATLVGGSVHEVAQVVAASAALPGDVLATAVTVKLARVVCLAGVVAVFALLARRRGEVGASGKRPTLVPAFVLGFLAMVVLGSLVPFPASVLSVVKIIQTASLAMAMTALGFGIQIAEIKKVGLKPVLLGFLATLLITGVTLGGVMLIS